MKKSKKKSWKLNLHPGDEIYIDNGEGPYALPSVFIAQIEYLPDGKTVKIVDTEGGKHECFLTEIA